MVNRLRKSKIAASVSVIGGADGPTSVFIAGRPKKQNFIEKIRRRRFFKNRKKAESSVRAGAHTFEETEDYLKNVYGAVELPKQSVYYQEQYRCVKESLILRYQPELLGELAIIPDLEGRDRHSIEAFIRHTKLRSEAAQAVSDEQFPIDFHIYKICTKAGMAEFAMERKWGLVSCSYSGGKGEMKKLKAIYKDVYLYYGVSEEDIRNKTERYQELVTVLAAD